MGRQRKLNEKWIEEFSLQSFLEDCTGQCTGHTFVSKDFGAILLSNTDFLFHVAKITSAEPLSTSSVCWPCWISLQTHKHIDLLSEFTYEGCSGKLTQKLIKSVSQSIRLSIGKASHKFLRHNKSLDLTSHDQPIHLSFLMSWAGLLRMLTSRFPNWMT